MGEVSEKVAYRLRRVGKPSTVVGVKDILPLKVDITRFGRHSGNDHYLDSKKLANFISRWHTEIHCVPVPEEDKLKFIVHDNSLNGTYVNDRRIDGDHVLQEGDHVTFGHRNGKNIQPGQLAKQHNSEFSFVFECVESECHSTSFVESSQQSQPGSPVLPLLGEIHRPNTGQDTLQDSSPRAQVSRQLLGGSSHSEVLRDIALTAGDKFIRCNTPSLVTPEPISPKAGITASPSEADQNHHHLTAGGVHHVQLSSTQDEGEIIQAAITNAEDFEAGSESDDDIFIVEPARPVKVEEIPVERACTQSAGTQETLPQASSSPLDNESTLSVSPIADVPEAPPLSATNCTRIKSPVRNNVADRVSDISTTSSKSGVAGACQQASRIVESASLVPAPSPSTIATPKSAPSKKTVAKPVKVQQKSVTPPSSSSMSNKSNKAVKNTGKRKRVAGGKTSAAKRRNSTAAVTSSDDDEDDDSDDYVWHHDGELCSAKKCSRPNESKVFWVQCDDCDEWFHTVCVGCSYDAVKDEDTPFYCGCVKRK